MSSRVLMRPRRRRMWSKPPETVRVAEVRMTEL